MKFRSDIYKKINFTVIEVRIISTIKIGEIRNTLRCIPTCTHRSL
jgi:hypothetical protein